MSAEQTGVRLQAVLDRLAGEDETSARAAEELVRELMAFYGEGLARIVELLPARALEPLLADPAAAGLLALHDLHPEPVGVRIDRALAAVPAYPAEVLGFEPATGRLRLRRALGGGSCGCGGGEQAAREAIEDSLGCFAPEVSEVELAKAPALLQIGVRPAVAEVR
ncbi:hypothetical protein [Kitasatospora camelliae]|uniref:Fe-S cluster biogenesis protein NfuA n=1 Tax=Kitasatospora camelliae TaxID=3156397 RepID=A0AAU8JSM7_9ACTN